MIEGYENWEDGIRRTFIELAAYMEKHANPIEFLIDFAWANGADRFVVNNAKDELLKLRQEVDNYKIVGWTRINSRGDLYDPRFCYNPFTQEESIPLYKNQKRI